MCGWGSVCARLVAAFGKCGCWLGNKEEGDGCERESAKEWGEGVAGGSNGRAKKDGGGMLVAR